MATTTTIAAGSTASVGLAAGSSLRLYGLGSAQLAPPGAPGTDSAPRTLGTSESTFGPYSVAATVNVAAGANGNGVSYYTVTPTTATFAVTPAGGGSALDIAPVQAQVSGAGLRPAIYNHSIPMVRQSSGTVGANGALSGIAALPATYSSCYMYFGAGALYSGNTAGWYYTVMSSTTAGTVYNNAYTGSAPGLPTIPATPTPIVDAGPGAYTQTTGAVTALNLLVAANSMGARGSLVIQLMLSMNNAASNKRLDAIIGGTTLASNTYTTVLVGRPVYEFRNQGVARQIGSNFTPYGSTATVDWNRSTVNTAIDQSLTLALAGATAASDFIVLEGVIVDCIYGA